MKKDSELKSWERFVSSGSVSDYLAYRQFVNRRNETAQGITGEGTAIADHDRGDRNPGSTLG